MATVDFVELMQLSLHVRLAKSTPRIEPDPADLGDGKRLPFLADLGDGKRLPFLAHSHVNAVLRTIL
ncbi:hypothetical protein NL676_024443 [Syzygium grande]|nr:hypothetical protein NL676_024443 [Syzygium grande]